MLRLYVILTITLCAAISFAHDPASMPYSPPYTCTTTTLCQPGIGTNNQQHPHHHHANVTHDPKLTQGRPGKRGGRGQKGEKGDPCQCDVADEEVVAALRQKMNAKNQEIEHLSKRLQHMEELVSFLPENCTEYRSHESEGQHNNVVKLYPMKSIGDLTPVMINCTYLEELQRSSDWIVIQRRKDGSVDFYRDWKSYREGFGDKNEEFWLGLLYIHWLTTEKNYKLRVDVTGHDGSTSYAEYSTFRVSDEAQNYRLTISGHSGTAPDRLTAHDGYAFTTYDRDNDIWGENCARRYNGAWWYHTCHSSNLNAKYSKTKSTNADYNRWLYTVKFGEMKIRSV